MAVGPIQASGFSDYPGKIIRMTDERGTLVRFPPIKKIFGGEIGGKARGLQFLRETLLDGELHSRMEKEFGTSVRFAMPKTTILGTDLFFSFMEHNRLWDLVEQNPPDDALLAAFQKAVFTESQRSALRKLFLADEESGHARPIAARSSNIVEDAERGNTAGIFKTVLLPNFHESEEVRLAQLEAAIKLVFASSFMNDAREYRLEKGIRQSAVEMAVILQNVVGRLWPGPGYSIYAPEFSGAGFGFNPFPDGHSKAEDGYFSLAIGLGPGVVENGKTAVMFNMKRPDPPMGMRDGIQALNAAPEYFYALRMDPADSRLPNDEESFLVKLPYTDHGSQELILRHSSGYKMEAGEGGRSARLVEPISMFYDEPTIVKFYNLIKGGFGAKLPKVMQFLADAYRQPLGGKPADYEMSGDIGEDGNGGKVLVAYLLQARVQATTTGNRVEALPDVEEGRRVLEAFKAIGDGNKLIRDVLYVPPEKFNYTKSFEIGQELGGVNSRLFSHERKYLLLAPGRVCTVDETLGIKGSFGTVSHAAAIGEDIMLNGRMLEPSGGAHIFQNIIDMKMAYFSYNGAEFSIGKLRSMASKVEQAGKYVEHLSFEKPLELKIDPQGNLLVYRE